MSTARLLQPTFHRYVDKGGSWVSGCLLCLDTVGIADSFGELAEFEDSHTCFEKKPPQSVKSV
jgi:hypothetical protein